MKKLLEAACKTIKSISVRFTERSVGAYSAQAAFFIFISFFPFAIILFYILNSIPNFEVALPEEALGFIPKILTTIIEEARRQAEVDTPHVMILIVSGLTALWAASKGIYGISMGLDSAYLNKKKKNTLLARLLSAVYTLLFVLIIVAVLGLLVFGNLLYEKAMEFFPSYAFVLFIIRSFRFIFLLFVLIFFFAISYKFLPSEKPRFCETLPGATIASVGWLAFSYIYSLYIDNYNLSSSIYGSLTTIVLLMLWLYFCMNILLFGALINSWLAESRITKAQQSTK